MKNSIPLSSYFFYKVFFQSDETPGTCQDNPRLLVLDAPQVLEMKVEPFWRMALGPRPRHALQRPALVVRGVRHMLLRAKELAASLDSRGQQRRGTRVAASRFLPSERMGKDRSRNA